ncbi:alpha-ketoglutarate-dependent 2,4-dichlorophenoxyacetate dioxygenase [alpha proteobacterium BAL199]|jgi:alpha-ketoglutarate-dependent 2,4-dichlorophenoxyacetate dioxygenase|nr:alpha-ketoglutarate-dependent 2,4-dichlorophenoxyacetate dioxygenase [alpha proteobacterium BAL199]
MALSIRPINPKRDDFVAEVTGLDIAAGVSKAVAEEIEDAINRYAVLVFPEQRVNDDQQYVFSTHFGPMETATGDIAAQGDRRLSMDINDISNLDKNGQVLQRDDRRRLFGLGNMLWHTDSSFKATPAKFSLLSARTIPGEGGNTEFADMRAAWDDLDPKTQADLMPLVAEHSQLYSRGLLGFDQFTDEERAKWAPVPQRMVRRHPGSGRLSVFLASHAGTIQGWPIPEARMFIRDLTEHATQREYTYAHRWRQYDLVMWDNRAVMHRARRYDHTQPRDMHRTTVADCAPTLEQPL